MSTYVDDMYLYPIGQFGRMKMSHMMADTTEELLAMADRIGVHQRWLQHAGTPGEHFDIAMSKRALAVQYGAIEVTARDLGRWLITKRKIASAETVPSTAAPKELSLPERHAWAEEEISILNEQQAQASRASIARFQEQSAALAADVELGEQKRQLVAAAYASQIEDIERELAQYDRTKSASVRAK